MRGKEVPAKLCVVTLEFAVGRGQWDMGMMFIELKGGLGDGGMGKLCTQPTSRRQFISERMEDAAFPGGITQQ